MLSANGQSLVPRPVDSTADAHDFLVRSLEAGQTGCISSTTAEGARIDVYVMLGEVLAAHAEDDADQLLRRLYNGRALTMSQMASARQRLAGGEALSEVLATTVADSALMDMFHQRFRENLFRFLLSPATPTFEALDAVMVDNIQVGHDSRDLLVDLVRLCRDLAPWLSEPDATFYPGEVTLGASDDATIFSLCTPSRRLQEVLQASPMEPTRTLLVLREFVRKGILKVRGITPPAAVPKREPTLAERLAATRASLRPDRPAASMAPPPPPTTVEMVPTRSLPRHEDEPDREDTVDDVVPVDTASRSSLRRAVRQAFDKVVKTEPAAARPSLPPPAPVTPPVDAAGDYVEVTEELDLFMDHDRVRGDGAFTTTRELLDVVDLTAADGSITAPPVAALPKYEGPIEMADAESAGADALAGAVTLNFAGPKLQEDEAQRKIEVANEVLHEISQSLDDAHGVGMGRARVQLLVEGTPGAFAPLFKHVEVDEHAHLPTHTVLKNLKKRPVSEHRRLLNRGLGDLIERALSLADESLSEDQLEHMLERIAGYQQRFGV